MYLKRLEIQGFKTFAGRLSIEFPPGVSAIVGPNGSGKSNCIDAIRWVLGEQSYAALRCRRTEDLIFSGGGKRAPLGMAEVALTFDNSDRVLSLPFNEVTIARRAYRSGENEYFINKSRVRLKDILEATAPLAQSYTIVNQGLVDAVLSLRPHERRGLFEDAAAVSLAAARKEEAERRLKEAEVNLTRLSDLLAELEPRLRVLKRQAREAEQAQLLQDEIASLLRRHYLRLWQEMSAAVEQTEREAAAAGRELALYKERMELCLAELRAARAELQEQRAALKALDDSLAGLQAESQALDRELAVVQERHEALARQHSEATAGLAALKRQIAEATETHAAALAYVEEAARAVEEARISLAELEDSQQAVRLERQAREQALEAAREAAFNAEAAVVAQRNRLAELERRRVELQAELAAQEREQQTARQRAAEARAAEEAAQAALEEAAALHITAREAEERATQTLEQLREERVRIEREAAAARRQADQLQSQLEALTRTQRSYTGAFAGVRAAMLWAERSGRSGFALVSSILRVPAELELAIETALGSRLQQIVVERWQDAEDAIEELKRSGAGRATFLPLDTLRSPRPATIPAALQRISGIVGLATELVEYDPHYKQAVSHLLGRTLIAEDLPAARRALAAIEGGWTIVTLAGEQVTSSGAVTGGAPTKESGTLRRERELRELPGQLAAARKRVAELVDAERHTAEQERAAHEARRAAEQRLREVRREEEQRRDALASRRRAAERAAQELSWHEARQAATRRELAALEERELDGRQALVQAQAQAASAAEALDRARVALDAQLTAGREAEEALLRARAELSEREAQLRGRQREVELQSGLLQDYEARLREGTARLATFAAEQRRLEEQRQRASGRQAALEQQISDLLGSRAALLAAIAEVERCAVALEEQEQALAAATLSAEAAYGRAVAALEGARVRRDQVWERCAEEGIDIEELAALQEAPAEVAEDGEHLQDRIEQLRARLRRMGEVNPLAPTEYAQVAERHTFLSAQLEDARAAAQSLREVIAELETTVRARFAETFQAVAGEFSTAFTRLFGGGNAELQLLQGEEGTAGIEIIAQPPGKRRQPLSLLSGGERALTSAALLFALLRVRPTPFCVLDEVDAALDEANVVRFRELLRELSAQTQFVVVTHNRGTVEIASTIYGVSMGADGASRVLSVRLEELALDEPVHSRELESVGAIL